MGEVIKYGAILDRKLFNQISNNIDSILLSKKSTLIFEMIIRCAELKVNVVTKDEKEIKIGGTLVVKADDPQGTPFGITAFPIGCVEEIKPIS